MLLNYKNCHIFVSVYSSMHEHKDNKARFMSVIFHDVGLTGRELTHEINITSPLLV